LLSSWFTFKVYLIVNNVWEKFIEMFLPFMGNCCSFVIERHIEFSGRIEDCPIHHS